MAILVKPQKFDSTCASALDSRTALVKNSASACNFSKKNHKNLIIDVIAMIPLVQTQPKSI